MDNIDLIGLDYLWKVNELFQSHVTDAGIDVLLKLSSLHID